MSLRLFDLGRPYIDIHALLTPGSCLSITLYCLHLLTLDTCAILDVVFTRVVYGAATEPRVPCVWPTPGKSLGSRCIKTYKGMTPLKLWNIRIHFLSPCRPYMSNSWKRFYSIYTATLYPLFALFHLAFLNLRGKIHRHPTIVHIFPSLG